MIEYIAWSIVAVACWFGSGLLAARLLAGKPLDERDAGEQGILAVFGPIMFLIAVPVVCSRFIFRKRGE